MGIGTLRLLQPYHLVLLAADGTVWDDFSLSAASDADAILTGNSLEYEHPKCFGVDVWLEGRLIYAHRAGPERPVALPFNGERTASDPDEELPAIRARQTR